MTDNPKELADEAMAWRLLGDAILDRSAELATRAAKALGRGTLYPSLEDGTELGSFNVPKGSMRIDFDLDLLTPWVKKWYEDEIMETVRPAFLSVLRERCKTAGRPAGPNGEADPPGVYVTCYDTGSPRITGYDAGKERARAAVDAVLERVIPAFATQELPGGQQ